MRIYFKHFLLIQMVIIGFLILLMLVANAQKPAKSEKKTSDTDKFGDKLDLQNRVSNPPTLPDPLPDCWTTSDGGTVCEYRLHPCKYKESPSECKIFIKILKGHI
jgi:hypothetical protein